MKFDASHLEIKLQEVKSIIRNKNSLKNIVHYKKCNIQIETWYHIQAQTINYHEQRQPSRAGQVWGIIAPPEKEKRHSIAPITYTIRDGNESVSVKSRNNWYDLGHIMALSLGGSDNRLNYILQAPDTNESGHWRTMERKINEKAKELLREKKPEVIYFGVNVVYTENPKNIHEVYIPIAMNVYLYKIPYVEYQKLDIATILPNESYDKLKNYAFTAVDKIIGKTASSRETLAITEHQSEGYTAYSNMLNEQDITRELEVLAIKRIEAIIQYLQGENLFALVLDKKNKKELDDIQFDYEVKEENDSLFLKNKTGDVSIDVMQKITKENVHFFSSEENLSKEIFKKIWKYF